MMKTNWMLGVSAVMVLGASADDWHAWRGPNGNGVAEASNVPLKFSVDENLLWKVKLPGRACSTPVVAGGRIFVTSPIGEEDGVIAFDTAGKEVWRKTLGKLRPGRGQRVGSSANSSPVTDGKTLFAYFKSGALAAFDLDGKPLWSTNIFEKYAEDKLWWDVGTSPVITSEGLVLPVMQTDGASFLICLDKTTGKEIWKTDREFDTAAESGDAYTTPHVLELDGRETVVCWGADHLTGHAADNGELLWTCGGFNPEKVGMWRVIASSVVTEGIAVVPFERGKSLAGVKLGGSGDITESAMLWKSSECGSDAATPIAHDGKVFVLSDGGKDRGTVTCVDAKTGKVDWQSKLPKGAQVYYSSPLLAGDTFYFPREDGVVFSAKLGPKGLENITENAVGENMIASPVVVDDMLLLRGDSHLMAFRKQ
jgi:outer membrane protein assembly factor BamB